MTSWSRRGGRNEWVMSRRLLLFPLWLLQLRRHRGRLWRRRRRRGGVAEYLRLREVRVFHSERKVYCEGWGLIFPAGFHVELCWFLTARSSERLDGAAAVARCCFWRSCPAEKLCCWDLFFLFFFRAKLLCGCSTRNDPDLHDWNRFSVLETISFNWPKKNDSEKNLVWTKYDK